MRGMMLRSDIVSTRADDHLGGITNCSGNVMYKAAGRSFLSNGGAGEPSMRYFDRA